MARCTSGLGASVTVLDYRGYGGSAGSPSEAGLINDGSSAVAWVRELQRASPAAGRRRLVTWGESIGSGVALGVATRGPPAAIVIEAGFSSCADIGANAYPWLPVHWLMKDKFDSSKRAAHLPVDMPVLMLHGVLDDIAPLPLAQRLFEALPNVLKEFVLFEATGHNDVWSRDSNTYLHHVAPFLAEVARSGEEQACTT